MEDTSQTITKKATPSILDIKQVEDIKPEPKKPEPQLQEDLQIPEIKEDESIFIQQPKQEKPVKKKRIVSERQKAHLAKMREARAKKAQAKKAQSQPKKIFKDPRPEKVVEPVRATPLPHTQPTANMSNQEYLNQFLSNMGRFMEVAQKLPTQRTTPHQSNLPSKKQVNQKQKPPTSQVKTPAQPLGVDFGFYNNYKNPFG